MKFNKDRFKKAIRGALTQEEVAAKLGRPQSSIARTIGRGEDMKLRDLTEIATICGFTESQVATFFEEDN